MAKTKLDKDMTTAVKFVSGAVPKSDYWPELTHLKIADGLIMSTSALMTMCAPIDLDVTARPHAKTFMDALKQCKSVITLALRDNGRLTVRSNKFRAHVPCIDDVDTPYFAMPEGEAVSLDGDQSEAFLNGLRTASYFMETDASKEYSNGVKLLGPTMMATDSRVAVQIYHGVGLPVDAMLPAEAVKQLLNTSLPIKIVQFSTNSVTFWFDDQKWLRTQLLNVNFPDVNGILDNLNSELTQDDLVQLPKAIFDDAESLKAFISTDEHSSPRLFLTSKGLQTDMTDEVGGVIAQPLPIEEGKMQCYNWKLFVMLKGVAEHINLSNYPGPCFFHNGANIRGAIIGIDIK